MIEKIQMIGKVLEKKGLFADYSNIFDDPGSGYSHIIPIEIDTRKAVAHVGNPIERGGMGKDTIPYRKGPSNGTDWTPVSRLTDPSKTIPKKIVAWFSKHRDKFGDIFEILNGSSNTLAKEIDNILSNIGAKGKKVLVVAKIDGKWPGQYLEIEDIASEFFDSLEFENGICYLCGKKNMVTGKGINGMGWPFYNLDKSTFLPEFSKPPMKICKQCLMEIFAGKNFTERHLGGKEWNISFFAIPYGDIGGVEFFIEETLDKRIRTHDLKEIEETVSEFVDLQTPLRIDVIFYDKKANTNEMKIIYDIYGIEPSRLSELHKISLSISKKFIWHKALKELLDDSNAMEEEKFSIARKIYNGTGLSKRRLQLVFTRALERLVKGYEYGSTPHKKLKEKYWNVVFLKKFLEKAGGVVMWDEDYTIAELVGRLVGYVHKIQKKAGRSKTLISLIKFHVNGKDLQRFMQKALEVQLTLIRSGEIDEEKKFKWAPYEKIKNIDEKKDYSFPFVLGLAREVFDDRGD